MKHNSQKETKMTAGDAKAGLLPDGVYEIVISEGCFIVVMRKRRFSDIPTVLFVNDIVVEPCHLLDFMEVIATDKIFIGAIKNPGDKNHE